MKRIKLWSFQHAGAIEMLQQEGVLRENWEHVSYPFGRYAYRWMMHQMARRGIHCNNRPPIWAWHSCGARGGCPTLTDAICLMGNFEKQWTVEFEAPASQVLLSRYGHWNTIIDLELGPNWKKLRRRAVFSVERANFLYESLQATLPEIRIEWVNDIRPLPDFGPEWAVPDERLGESV